MKKIAVLGLLASVAFASPAMAQATGTVAVNGFVTAKCTITSAAPASIELNELALSNGTVDSAFSNVSSAGLTRAFTVKCTSGSPTVAVSSDALNNTVDQTTGNGYTGRVHYTSTVEADKSTTGSVSTSYTSADSLPAASTVSVGVPLKNAANNVRVTVSNGTTTNSGDLLKSGTYKSTITVTVTPT